MNIQCSSMSPLVNSCRLCGATCYRRVIERDGSGALVATALYRCVGCSVVFADPKAWRDGEDPKGLPLSAAPIKPATEVRSLAPSPPPRGPNWRTYMPGLPGESKGLDRPDNKP